MLADNSVFVKKNCPCLLAQEEFSKGGSRLKSSFYFFSINSGCKFSHLCSESAEEPLCVYVSSLFRVQCHGMSGTQALELMGTDGG